MRRSIRQALACALVLGSCSSPSATNSSTTPTAPPSAPEESVASTVTSAPATMAPEPDLADASQDVGGALGLAMGTGNLPEPDDRCVARSFGALPARAGHALQTVEEDPLAWETLDGDDAALIAQAYLGCLDDGALVNWVALGVLRILDQLPCVQEAWSGVLTDEIVASSLAYGDGLDDLPPDTVEQLTSAAQACVPDRQWWIEEVALRLEVDLEDEQAQCVAIAYLDVLGIDAAIRRRILTIPLLSVPPEDRDQLDLGRRCGIEEPPALPELRAAPGTCLTGFGTGTENTAAIACAQAHNAEVVSVHDLVATFPSWPGAAAIRGEGEQRCLADVKALPADVSNHAAGWDLPSRATWEQGARALTCTLVRPQFESWTGPSGLPLPPEPPPTTSPANLGQKVLDPDVLVVGQCLYRAPEAAGQTLDDRPLYVADCATPHQSEVFHVFDIAAEPGAPFPGDEETAAQAENGCIAAFEGYVGIAYEQSRLYLGYFYPDEPYWAGGGRKAQCLLEGEGSEELFTRSLAGSRE